MWNIEGIMDNGSDDQVVDWKPFYREHVFALAAGDEAAEAVKSAILGTGVEEANLKVYKGCDGYISIDPAGEYHGLKGKLARALQLLGQELPAIQNFADQVLKGDTGFAVAYRDEAHKDELLERLKEASARKLVYTTKLGFYFVPQ